MNLIVTKICNNPNVDDDDDDKNYNDVMTKKISVTNNSLVNFLWRWRWIHAFFFSILLNYILPFTKNYFLRIIFIVVSQCVKGKARTKHTVKQINEWMLWKEHTFKHIILNILITNNKKGHCPCLSPYLSRPVLVKEHLLNLEVHL